MAVKIRMKMMGRKHRPFFRICATDSRAPRDGRVIEEIGTYDPMIADTDARVVLNMERINYWLSVGAQPSQNVKTFIKKYGVNGTRLKEQAAAREKLALPKAVPDPGEPKFVPKPKSEVEAAAPAAENGAPAGESDHAEAGTEAAAP